MDRLAEIVEDSSQMEVCWNYNYHGEGNPESRSQRRRFCSYSELTSAKFPAILIFLCFPGTVAVQETGLKHENSPRNLLSGGLATSLYVIFFSVCSQYLQYDILLASYFSCGFISRYTFFCKFGLTLSKLIREDYISAKTLVAQCHGSEMFILDPDCLPF